MLLPAGARREPGEVGQACDVGGWLGICVLTDGSDGGGLGWEASYGLKPTGHVKDPCCKRDAACSLPKTPGWQAPGILQGERRPHGPAALRGRGCRVGWCCSSPPRSLGFRFSAHLWAAQSLFSPRTGLLLTLDMCQCHFPGGTNMFRSGPALTRATRSPRGNSFSRGPPPSESHPGHPRHLPGHCKFSGLGPAHGSPPPRPAQPKPTSWLPMSVFTQPG